MHAAAARPRPSQAGAHPAGAEGHHGHGHGAGGARSSPPPPPGLQRSFSQSQAQGLLAGAGASTLSLGLAPAGAGGGGARASSASEATAPPYRQARGADEDDRLSIRSFQSGGTEPGGAAGRSPAKQLAPLNREGGAPLPPPPLVRPLNPALANNWVLAPTTPPGAGNAATGGGAVDAGGGLLGMMATGTVYAQRRSGPVKLDSLKGK